MRGAGFFIGADVVKPGTKEPDYEHAVDFIEAMREHHVLTSLCGPAGNILKIRPPLVFSPNDVDHRTTRRRPREDAQASVRVHPCHWHHLRVFTCGGDGGCGGRRGKCARYLGIEEGHPVLRVLSRLFDDAGAVAVASCDSYNPNLVRLTVTSGAMVTENPPAP